jgi:hypothetical protein
MAKLQQLVVLWKHTITRDLVMSPLLTGELFLEEERLVNLVVCCSSDVFLSFVLMHRVVWHQANPISRGTRWALVIFFAVL